MRQTSNDMKKVFSTVVLLHLAVGVIVACTVCGKQQPKITRGITHGTGPQSDWDYVIVCATALIVLISLYYAIKWIAKPGESENSHIKHSRFILE